MPDSTDSETVTAETFVIQAMEEVPDAVQRYATGDKAAFNEVKARAVKLAAGRVNEEQISNSLASKFGDGM